ncbi:hypothetical protein PGQ11_015522 [Apiospora arundinis]|uniref:Uncharacterized protein n=1 Tax=Apiospora arundinis TaxID=335852 RepID=A0ABR2HLL4_9PEZI
MHLYRFSYPISRPYPFQWFTPLVIVGGLLLSVLFSFMTFPANAYDMKQEPSFDPNKTTKEEVPYLPFGWWDGENLKPKCQPFDLSVGSRFFTTNKGFLYTVDKVYQYNPETNENETVVQSVPYLNNPLEDCHPTDIIISLTKDDMAEPPTWWISWVGNSYFEAKATCVFHTEKGPARIDISMKKSGVAKDLWDYIIAPDSKASFWWGAQLLNTYWFSLLQVLSQKGRFEQKRKEDGFFNRGRFTFTFEPAKKNKSIRDVDFHKLWFYLIPSLKAHPYGDEMWQNELKLSLDDRYNNPKNNISLALTEASYFAKIMHSFLVADLGNPDIPNMLLKEEDLRYFLSGKANNTNRQPGGMLSKDSDRDKNFAFLYRLQTPPHSNKLVPLDESWDAFKSDMGNLGTRSATIYKQYTCSILRKKSWGKIVLLVLVADLVFLQAAWKLLNLVAGFLVEQQAPVTAMVCAGCLEGIEKGLETPVELQNLIPENEDGQRR